MCILFMQLHHSHSNKWLFFNRLCQCCKPAVWDAQSVRGQKENIFMASPIPLIFGLAMHARYADTFYFKKALLWFTLV